MTPIKVYPNISKNEIALTDSEGDFSYDHRFISPGRGKGIMLLIGLTFDIFVFPNFTSIIQEQILAFPRCVS